MWICDCEFVLVFLCMQGSPDNYLSVMTALLLLLVTDSSFLWTNMAGICNMERGSFKGQGYMVYLQRNQLLKWVLHSILLDKVGFKLIIFVFPLYAIFYIHPIKFMGWYWCEGSFSTMSCMCEVVKTLEHICERVSLPNYMTTRLLIWDDAWFSMHIESCRENIIFKDLIDIRIFKGHKIFGIYGSEGKVVKEQNLKSSDHGISKFLMPYI